MNYFRKGHTVFKCGVVCASISPYNTAPHLQPTTTIHAILTTSVTDRVRLATAVILVMIRSGEYLPARVLLDSGSQVNFMKEELAQKLQIRRKNDNKNWSFQYERRGKIKRALLSFG